MTGRAISRLAARARGPIPGFCWTVEGGTGALIAFVIVVVTVVYLLARLIVLRNIVRRDGGDEED
jgi:hypothetical protein